MSSDIASRVVEAINQKDYSAIERLTSPEVQLRLPPGQVFFGHEGVHAFISELERVLPELTVIARRQWTGMGFSVVEFESAGRSARNDPSESLGAIVLELNGEQIRRIQVYLDTAQWDELHKQASERQT
ncbi:MAG: nuclear transport factor 2 family protein [Chloroflexi bacterium]|nr:MAG: nuclear transport factor 2 family protein [Chloroflexota bacterium]